MSSVNSDDYDFRFIDGKLIFIKKDCTNSIDKNTKINVIPLEHILNVEFSIKKDCLLDSNKRDLLYRHALSTPIHKMKFKSDEWNKK